MATFSFIAQDVQGDPFVSGGTIGIVNGSTTPLVFNDIDDRLGVPSTGETVSVDGGLTYLSYTFLGFGDVRGDPLQRAGFIRVNVGGTFRTYAIDMNADGDGVPDLANGNTGLTVSALTTGSNAPFPVPSCFVAGMQIATLRGPVPIEWLRPGDRVWTQDNGYQPILGIHRTRVPGTGQFAPVRFATGSIGNSAPLLVSPQHRMLVCGWRAELFCGEPEVLVPAFHMVNGATIARVTLAVLDYLHIEFREHELVEAQGAVSESFLPRRAGFAGDAPAENARLFDDQAGHPGIAKTVRPVVSQQIARLLANAA